MTDPVAKLLIKRGSRVPKRVGPLPIYTLQFTGHFLLPKGPIGSVPNAPPKPPENAKLANPLFQEPRATKAAKMTNGALGSANEPQEDLQCATCVGSRW